LRPLVDARQQILDTTPSSNGELSTQAFMDKQFISPGPLWRPTATGRAAGLKIFWTA
jgi:hypothetical protein